MVSKEQYNDLNTFKTSDHTNSIFINVALYVNIKLVCYDDMVKIYSKFIYNTPYQIYL